MCSIDHLLACWSFRFMRCLSLPDWWRVCIIFLCIHVKIWQVYILYICVSKNKGKNPKWMVKIMVQTLSKFMIWGVLPLFLVKHLRLHVLLVAKMTPSGLMLQSASFPYGKWPTLGLTFSGIGIGGASTGPVMLWTLTGTYPEWTYLENQLLLISINFTPKTSHSCQKKWYTRFSRYL